MQENSLRSLRQLRRGEEVALLDRQYHRLHEFLDDVLEAGNVLPRGADGAPVDEVAGDHHLVLVLGGSSIYTLDSGRFLGQSLGVF